MDLLYFPAILAAFVLTALEFTEVVVLVFALSADTGSIRHGALGAIAGTAVVATIAVLIGASLAAFPREYLLWASAALLAAFSVFLFRSTLRSYRREAAARAGAPAPGPHRPPLQFVGGFSVGAVETTEVVVVLIAIAAAGYGGSAVIGAVAAGITLVIAAAIVHEQLRKIKVPWLKLGATAMLLTFAVFWGGEAAGVAWPGSDLFLLPLFLVFLVLTRALIAVMLRRAPVTPPPGPAAAPIPPSSPPTS